MQVSQNEVILEIKYRLPVAGTIKLEDFTIWMFPFPCELMKLYRPFGYMPGFVYSKIIEELQTVDIIIFGVIVH